MAVITNGIKMHVRLHGPEHGLPLLFIHGYPFTGAMWEPLIELLGDEFRLIIPDLRGFGASELSPHHKPSEVPPMSIAQYADDLFVMLEQVGENRPLIVIGLSMGGYIAFEFHRRFTSRVRALVLVDTRAHGDTPEQMQQRIATAQRVLIEGSSVVANAMVDKLFAPQSSSQLRDHWHKAMLEIAPESIAAALFAMAGRGGYVELLDAIFCPTLIVVGEQDIITPPADAQAMQRSILSSQLEIIANAGHLTPLEQPHEFAVRVMDFLERHSLRSESAISGLAIQ